jgi:L1 cell adhesion molecule like protein
LEDTLFIDNFYKEESLNLKITRAQFEEISKEFFSKLKTPIERVLSDSKMKPEQINEIVLVGGSSKIPKIKQILKEIFPNVIINDSINPDEAVAYGAAISCESERRDNGDF